MAPPDFTVVVATAAQLIDLRRRVLRDGRVDLSASHPLDDEPDTLHLAALDPGGTVVGCVSLVSQPCSFGETQVPTHLVLMAVDPSIQGAGVGARLVTEAQRRFGDGIWAAARVSALGFYERLGFVPVGDEYIGRMDLPHREVMWVRALR